MAETPSVQIEATPLAKEPEAPVHFREGEQVIVMEEFVPNWGNDACQALVKGTKGKVVSFYGAELGGDAKVDFGGQLRRVSRTDFAKLAKVRKEPVRNFETELKRLMGESGTLFDAQKFGDALTCAIAAVDSLEAKVESLATGPRLKDASITAQMERAPPVASWLDGVTTADGAKEVKQLITAYTQRVRCHLALRDFQAARDTAVRAAKLQQWEEERLLADFDLMDGLRSTVPLVELLQAVGDAAAGLQAAEVALSSNRNTEALDLAAEALRVLEKKDWAASTPLRAELYALRAEVALRTADEAASEADAERGVALDPGCARAQAILEEARQQRGRCE